MVHQAESEPKVACRERAPLRPGLGSVPHLLFDLEKKPHSTCCASVSPFSAVVLHNYLQALGMGGEPWARSFGGRESLDEVWTRPEENIGSFD